MCSVRSASHTLWSVLFARGHWVALPPWPRFSVKLLHHQATCGSYSFHEGSIHDCAIRLSYAKSTYFWHLTLTSVYAVTQGKVLRLCCNNIVNELHVSVGGFHSHFHISCFLCRFFYFVHTEFCIYCIWWARWAATRPGALGKKRCPLLLTPHSHRNRYRWDTTTIWTWKKKPHSFQSDKFWYITTVGTRLPLLTISSVLYTLYLLCPSLFSPVNQTFSQYSHCLFFAGYCRADSACPDDLWQEWCWLWGQS